MIKALLLIFEPVTAWDKVARAERSVGFIFGIYLVPMLLLGAAAEAYGLHRWGKARPFTDQPKIYTVGEAVLFEVMLFVVFILAILFAAQVVKMLGHTFHGRNTFKQTFTAMTYGLSPLFTLRLLDAFPAIPWPVAWGVGIALSVAILYQGLPRLMLPDPPHAFGLYLMTSILLILITGLIRFGTTWFLEGQFAALEKKFFALAAKLPF